MAIRIVALFAVYSGLAFVGSQAFGLVAEGAQPAADAPGEPVADDGRSEIADGQPEIADGQPQIADGQPEIADGRPETVTRVRVRRDGRCDYAVERELTIPASGIELVDIRAGSGDLHVEGEDGLEEIVVVGEVCASDEDFVDELQITAESAGGDVLLLETHHPELDGWGGSRTARIDLVVRVPTGLAVDIDDSSGGIDVRRTGALRIEDSSGGISVLNVDGSVEIDDSSGSVDVDGVRGDLRIEDSSGGIELRSVSGSVELRDGSGSIEVADVGLDVVVESDGSGSIQVRDVGGDFVVDRDGSGSIRHSGIRGSVDIPTDRRRHR